MHVSDRDKWNHLKVAHMDRVQTDLIYFGSDRFLLMEWQKNLKAVHHIETVGAVHRYIDFDMQKAPADQLCNSRGTSSETYWVLLYNVNLCDSVCWLQVWSRLPIECSIKCDKLGFFCEFAPVYSLSFLDFLGASAVTRFEIHDTQKMQNTRFAEDWQE